MTYQEREEIQQIKELIEEMANQITILEEQLESLCEYDSYGNRV